MVVYVLNHNGKPLMPCRPQKARKLLTEGKAKVVRRTPFTIQLLFGSGTATQDVVAGMDTGSKKVGCAAITNRKVVYAAEVAIRTNISSAMKRRATFRRTRRGRKQRYRQARWNNRASLRTKGRLAPSLRSKVESHLRERRFVESILPITKWFVETAQFDIRRLTDPDVSGVGYQQGPLTGYENVKAFVLHRDDYRCQHKARGVKHDKQLHVHHVIWRSRGGTDKPDNLLTLCRMCHASLHAGEWELTKRRQPKTRHATHMGIIQSQLKKSAWAFIETFGYLTKMARQRLALPKSHVNDAIAAASRDLPGITLPVVFYLKKHVPAGDYKRTRGSRSEQIKSTGRRFGLRRFDLVRTPKGTGFIVGTRKSGCFSIETLAGQRLGSSVSIKKNCVRLAARSTTLTSISIYNR